MRDQKYVVFKRDEWTQFLQASQVRIIPAPLMDAVVIRQQDIFAPPALDAYSNSITAAIELAKGSGLDTAELQSIADYFHERAAESWLMERKIPD